MDTNNKNKLKEVVSTITDTIVDKGTETINNAIKPKEIASTITNSIVDKGVETINNGLRTAKLYLILIVVAIVVIAATITLFAYNPFGWELDFGIDNSVKIEDTANVVEKIRNISEFTTCCFYEEYVVKSEKEEKRETKKFLGLFGGTSEDIIRHEIVITAKGSVRAGFNLAKLSESDFAVHGDTIDINLPTAEIFDVISNPSDYTIFIEEGKWSHDEIGALQSNAKMRTLNNALQSGILEKANTNGKEYITNLLKAFGFNVIHVKIAEK